MTLIELKAQFPEIDFSKWDKALVAAMLSGEKSKKPERNGEPHIDPHLQKIRRELECHTDFSYQHKQGRLLKHIKNCEAQYSRWKGNRDEAKSSVYSGLVLRG